jgi:hypothetical protein
MLERRAATGGELIAFATRNTCLSQFCHVDGTYEEKPLKQRYHQFADATRVGRDLYSAFLARYVQDGCLDAIPAAHAWIGTQAFLRAASDGFKPARGRALPFPTSLLASERVAVLNGLARPGMLRPLPTWQRRESRRAVRQAPKPLALAGGSFT